MGGARCMRAVKNGQPTPSPLGKDFEHGSDSRHDTDQIHPLQPLFELHHDKHVKHDESNDLLNRFQLGGGKFSALIIHERFYCDHGYTAAAGGLATCLRDFATNRHESPELVPDPIGWHLQAVLKERDAPAGYNCHPQGRVFVLQMPIPGKGHKDIGDG